jgi:tetratricopeptide (TPR) repeat protein
MNAHPHMTRMLALLLFLAPGVGSAANATELFQQSFTLESAGSYAGALDRMESLQAQGEDGYLMHLRRGWLLYLNGRYADSAEAYRSAISKEALSIEARTGMTLPLMALKRWSDAEAICDQILKIAPGNYLGQSRRAWILFSAGRFSDAEKAYADVLQQYPSDNDMLAGLGWSQLRQGRKQDAGIAFEAVLHSVPGHVSAGQGIAALE